MESCNTKSSLDLPLESLSLQPFLQSLHKEQWQEVRLGEVAEIISGGTPKTSIPEYWNGEIPWLSVADFNNGKKYVIASEKFITQLGLQESSTKLLQRDDIIISARGTVGVIAMIPYPMAFNQSCYGLRICGNAHSHFIYYCLKVFTKYFIRQSYGAVFDTITTKILSDFTFLLPPLTIQQKIAEILSSFDDKIDLLHRQNKTLESLALTLFRHYFIDNPNRSEWELGKLGDFCKVKKGKSITQKSAIQGIYPVVAGGLKPAYYHNECNTQSPVVTISASGNAGFVNIYYCPIWSSDSSYIDKTITPYVYFFYLFLKHHQNILYDKQEGSVQQHIYPSHIMDLEMPHYPAKLTQNFEVEVEAYFEKISHNAKQIQNLQAMRDMLLKAIFNFT